MKKIIDNNNNNNNNNAIIKSNSNSNSNTSFMSVLHSRNYRYIKLSLRRNTNGLCTITQCAKPRMQTLVFKCTSASAHSKLHTTN